MTTKRKSDHDDDHHIENGPALSAATEIDPELLDAARQLLREAAEAGPIADAAMPVSTAVSVPRVQVQVDDASVDATTVEKAAIAFDRIRIGENTEDAADPKLTDEHRAQLEEQAVSRGVDPTALSDRDLVEFVDQAETVGAEHAFLPHNSAIAAAAEASLVGGSFAIQTEGGKIDSGDVTIYDDDGRPVMTIPAGEEVDPAAVQRAVIEQNEGNQQTEVDGYLADGYTVVAYADDGSVVLQSPDGGQVRVHPNGNVTVERTEDDPAAADGNGDAPAEDGGDAPAKDSDPDDDDDDDTPETDAPPASEAPPPPPPDEQPAADPAAAEAGTPTPDSVATNPNAAAEFYSSPLFGRGAGAPDIAGGSIPDDPEGGEPNEAARAAFDASPLGQGKAEGLDKALGSGPAREDFEFGAGERYMIDPREIDGIELAAAGGGTAQPEPGEVLGPRDPLGGADVPVIGLPPIVGGGGGGGTHEGADLLGPVSAIDSASLLRDVDLHLDTASIRTDAVAEAA